MKERHENELELAAFAHQPLNTSVNSIRVITIVSSKKRKSPIRCVVRHRILGGGEMPGHVCLSYMWGPDAPLKTIIVNGRRYEIRRNLWRFLQVARKLGIRSPLWIDAISIDQDNPEERNHQVRLMTKIYQLAQRVIVWPEPVFSSLDRGNGNGFALSLSRRIRSAASNRCLMAGLYGLASTLIPGPDGPYWNRLWILQELLLARDLFIVIGDRLLPWYKFELLCHYKWHGTTSAQEIEGRDSAWKALESSTDPLRSIMSQVATKSILVDNEDAFTKNLLSALKLSSGRQCADTRDRLYGILGIVDRKGTFSVDYNVPAAGVLLNVVSELAKRDTVLEDLFPGITGLAAAFEVACVAICMECAFARPQISREGMPYGPWSPGHESPFILLTLDREDLPSWDPKDEIQFEANECAACHRKICSEPLQDWTSIAKIEVARCTEKQLYCLPKYIDTYW